MRSLGHRAEILHHRSTQDFSTSDSPQNGSHLVQNGLLEASKQGQICMVMGVSLYHSSETVSICWREKLLFIWTTPFIISNTLLIPITLFLDWINTSTKLKPLQSNETNVQLNLNKQNQRLDFKPITNVSVQLSQKSLGLLRSLTWFHTVYHHTQANKPNQE